MSETIALIGKEDLAGVNLTLSDFYGNLGNACFSAGNHNNAFNAYYKGLHAMQKI